jgi:hypothetical protein
MIPVDFAVELILARKTNRQRAIPQTHPGAHLL